jgi:hypothetical protein
MNFNNQKTQHVKTHYFHLLNQDSTKVVSMTKVSTLTLLKTMNIDKKRKSSIKSFEFDKKYS